MVHAGIYKGKTVSTAGIARTRFWKKQLPRRPLIRLHGGIFKGKRLVGQWIKPKVPRKKYVPVHNGVVRVTWMRDRKHPINIYSFANHGNRTMQLKPNPFVVMPVQRATQQYKQDWVVRLKKVVDPESRNDEIPRNVSVDVADTADLDTKTNEKNSAKSPGLLFRENLKDIGWWKAARHDDVTHMKRIINQPEFQTSRAKVQLLRCQNTHGNNALHIACLSGSFKVVLLLLRTGAEPLWENGSARDNAFQIAKRFDLSSGKKISLLALMNSYISDLKQVDNRPIKKNKKQKKKKKKTSKNKNKNKKFGFW